MPKQIKKCAVCEEEVERGSGMYYHGRLLHEKCYEKAQWFWWRL